MTSCFQGQEMKMHAWSHPPRQWLSLSCHCEPGAIRHGDLGGLPRRADRPGLLAKTNRVTTPATAGLRRAADFP